MGHDESDNLATARNRLYQEAAMMNQIPLPDEAAFLTDLYAVKRRDRRDDEEMIWILLQPLLYYSKIQDELYVVPDGFITDYASVPRLPLAYLLTGDTVHAPAVVHDWLIRDKIVPRRVADQIFLEAMKADKVPWWRRTMMYLAVAAYTMVGAKNS